MAIEEIAKGLTTTGRSVQPLQEEEKKKNVVTDVLAAPFRGVEGAVQGIYKLADWATGDELLPDYNKRYLGRSNTIAGGLVEGVAQFLTGFVPVAGQLGRVGNFAKLSSKVGTKTALKLARKSKDLSPKELRTLRAVKKLKKSKTEAFTTNVAAGASADFLVFDAQEERLSNLINLNPALRNPVTEYLAADGEDTELEGRFKNVIEGLFLEAGMSGVVVPFFKSLKMIKTRNNALKEGKSKEEATEDALGKSDLTEDEINGARGEADAKHDADDAKLDDTGDDYLPEQQEFDFSDMNYRELKEEANRQGLDTTGTKAEIKTRLEEKMLTINTNRGFDTKFDDLNIKQLKEEANRQGLDTKGTKADLIKRLKDKANKVLDMSEEDAVKTGARSSGGVKNPLEETTFKSEDEPDYDPANAQKTQRGNTIPTYEKIGSLLGEGKRLDIGAGLGQGAAKIGADTYEPFPKGDFKPDYTKASDIPSDSYENITSLNTLNVVPPDVRKGIVNDIGRVLKQGGTAIIQTRDVNQIKGIKNFKEGAEQGSKITNDGTYQKGFTKQELKEYVQETLGDGYEVTIVPSKAKVNGSAVQVKKIKSTADEGGAGGKPPEEGSSSGGAGDGEVSKPIASIFNDLKTGGKQAILSAARMTRNSFETAKLVRAMSLLRLKRLQDEGRVPKTTAKELIKQSKEYADIMGGDVNSWSARISEMAKNGDDLTKVLEEQRAIRELQEVIGADIAEKAKAVNDAIENNVGNVDALRTDLLSSLDQFSEVQRIWSLYGRNSSLALLQRKFMYKKGHYKRKFGFSTKNTNAASQQAYRNQARGSMSEKKMFKMLALATNADDIKNGISDESLVRLNKLSKGARGRLMFDMTREYWINSLLSAPTTQLVNIMGNMITYAMRSAETAVGAALTGNSELFKAQISLGYHMESVAEAWGLMCRAIKNDEAITVANHRAFDDTSFELGAISGESARKISGDRIKDDGILYGAMDWMGKTARLPSRFLLGGDEFFKALSYRQYIRTELATTAMRQGIKDPKKIAAFVEKGLDSHLTSTGRAFSEENILRDANQFADEKNLAFQEREDFIEDYMQRNYTSDEQIKVDQNGVAYKVGTGEERQSLGDRGAQYAKVNSHTQDSDIASLRTISKLIADNPWMSFVVPFVRTPTNILTFGVSRTGFGLLHKDSFDALKMFKKEYRDSLNQADARTKAEMVGRLATAVSTVSALLWYVQTNQNFITGYGAKRKEQRDAEKLGGFQEYSLRIPREGKPDLNISYQRLDPMATMLGIMADIVEYKKYDESGTDKMTSLIFSNLAATVVNNITNKSYVQGLDNLFNVLRDPTKNGERFIGNIAGGFVPNVFNQAQNYQEDRMLRETRGMLDYMIKRTPMADKLSPRRNLLGEIETVPQSGLAGVFNPIYTKEIPDNIVEQEIGSMGVGFSKPTELLGGNKNLDMRDFSNEEGGQTAYDRYAELAGTVKINNMTLRQALEKLMNSSYYQGLPSAAQADELGEKSPRIKEIQKYLSSFREVARNEMLGEYPELQQAYYAAHQQKLNLKN